MNGPKIMRKLVEKFISFTSFVLTEVVWATSVYFTWSILHIWQWNGMWCTACPRLPKKLSVKKIEWIYQKYWKGLLQMTIRVLKMDLIEVEFGEKLKALKFSNWETLAKLEAISN